MKINKKKFIYLISPNKISKNFYQILNKILKSKKIGIFQLRLKNYSFKQKIIFAKKIKLICKKNNVKFLINDDPYLAKKINADGCHLGQNDVSINTARKLLKKKIIGITCHNSIKLAEFSKYNGADYVAFGSFYKTKTKKINYYANPKTLKLAKKVLKIFVVAIGGINNSNHKILLDNGADMIAMSSFIWKNKNPINQISLF